MMLARFGLLWLLLASGCARPAVQEGPWRSATLHAVRQTGTLQDSQLRESSGVAVSRRHARILWTHNDAGNRAELFATDSTGSALGRWRVQGTENIDWEDIALAPCPAGACLTIGDVGDNAERRPRVVLYRIPEPDPAAPGPTPPAEALLVRYPDRPRDVEAIWVDHAGDTWLVSKGRNQGVFLYQVPAAAWSGDSATAVLVGTLPIPIDLMAGRAVTSAAISPDGRTVVIRTYRELYRFARAQDGALTPAPGPNRCDITGLGAQGEAVDWLDDSTLVMTSEGGGGARGAVHVVRCG